MKIIFRSVLCVALAFCSCQSSNDDMSQMPSDGIAFSSTIKSHTRATDLAFEEGDQISVLAFDGEQAVAENVQYSYSNGMFTSSNPIEQNSKPLSFSAVYPYQEDFGSSFDFAVETDQREHSNYTLSDLMFASVSETSESKPNLDFSHKLVKLVFNLSTEAEADSQIYVEALTSVECNIDDNSYVGVGEVEQISARSTSATSFKVIIAPQTIDADHEFVTFDYDGQTYKFSSSESVSLRSGMQYNITLSLDSEELSFGGMIDPWEDGEIEVAPEAGGESETEGVNLADISSDNYPEGSVWTILDDSFSSSDLDGVKSVLPTLDYTVTLKFANATTIPGDSFYYFGTPIAVDAPEATAIEYSAFARASVVSINMPKVESVGSMAFYYCASLSEVNAPALKSIGYSAFSYCSALTSFEAENLESIGDEAFSYSVGIQTVSFPSVLTVGTSAFNSCDGLTSAQFDNATSFGNTAFKKCDLLESVVAPKLQTIGNYTFDRCEALKSVDYPEVTEVGEEAFSENISLTSLSLPKLVTIGDGAFYDCSGIESFDFSEATTVGIGAFYGCTSLTSVSLPLVVTLEENLFSGCVALESVEAPNTKSIRASAFYDCVSLEEVSFPKTSSLGSEVFMYCDNLKSIEIASAEGVTLGTITYGFDLAPVQNITLTLGAANSSYVDGATLTRGVYSITFKDIVLK